MPAIARPDRPARRARGRPGRRSRPGSRTWPRRTARSRRRSARGRPRRPGSCSRSGSDWPGRHRDPEDLGLAARRPGQAGEEPDQGGLARSVRAEQAVDPAGREVEADIVDRANGAERLDEPLARIAGSTEFITRCVLARPARPGSWSATSVAAMARSALPGERLEHGPSGTTARCQARRTIESAAGTHARVHLRSRAARPENVGGRDACPGRPSRQSTGPRPRSRRHRTVDGEGTGGLGLLPRTSPATSRAMTR